MKPRPAIPSSVPAIADRLRRLRRRSGLNKTDFAALCSITKTAWSNYESGTRRITIEAAIRVADACDVTEGYIYRGSSRGMDPQVMLELQRNGNSLPPRRD